MISGCALSSCSSTSCPSCVYSPILECAARQCEVVHWGTLPWSLVSSGLALPEAADTVLGRLSTVGSGAPLRVGELEECSVIQMALPPLIRFPAGSGFLIRYDEGSAASNIWYARVSLGYCPATPSRVAVVTP